MNRFKLWWIKRVAAIQWPEGGARSCYWCKGNHGQETGCPEQAPDGFRFLCTRPKGHRGPHIGCGSARSNHAKQVWED
jgi:hypothetical protein